MIYSSTTFMNTNTHTNKKVGQVSRPPHLENRVKCIGKILFTCLELGNYAKLCFTNELHDILNLRTIRHLVNNLVDSIEYACIPCHSLRGIHVVGTCAHLRYFCHLPYNVGIKYSAIARKGTDNQEDKGRFPPYNHFIHPMVYIAKKGLYTLLSRCIDP